MRFIVPLKWNMVILLSLHHGLNRELQRDHLGTSRLYHSSEFKAIEENVSSEGKRPPLRKQLVHKGTSCGQVKTSVL